MNIELEHPEYVARKAMWRTYGDLYAGGERLKMNATQYLVPRQKEPADVYGERLSRVFYENYIGSIIDWYAATLFRREPILSFAGENEPARSFFCELTEDCDLKQTSLCDFFRRQLVQALIGGVSYTLVDFPRFSKPAANRAEEDQLGASRAYLVGYGPEDLINWSYDDHGNFEWVILRTSTLRQDTAADTGWAKETRWSYYDKDIFRVFRQMDRPGEMAKPELVDEGRHGLAGLHRVPLFPLTVNGGLWLMNKAALLQLEHFNKSNALGWALTMGLFAMPVVYSEREWKQIVGESYYIQLAPGDRFGWTEPDGKVYQIAADNLDRLKNEIYRVCYMIPQAWDVTQAQSGLSKLRDFTITQEVLRAYGDAVKDTMKRVLRSIEAARQDGLTVDASGLDEFDIGDFKTELDDAGTLLSLEAGSKTLRKEVLKKLAYKYLCDMRQELKDQIAAEIDESNG
jgi:hypothetical protein